MLAKPQRHRGKEEIGVSWRWQAYGQLLAWALESGKLKVIGSKSMHRRCSYDLTVLVVYMHINEKIIESRGWISASILTTKF
jgi:hypothetical protein